MKIFLIDFENVHSDGITGVDFLSENDEVVIFYSNNADSITFEMMHKLMFCKAKLNYYKVRRGGRNALDFQMSSYLGYLVEKYSDKPDEVEFYLVSKDTGFDFVIDFWTSGNIDVNPKINRFYTIKAAFALCNTGNNKFKPKVIQPVPVSPKLPQQSEAVQTVSDAIKAVESVQVQTVSEAIEAVESVTVQNVSEAIKAIESVQVQTVSEAIEVVETVSQEISEMNSTSSEIKPPEAPEPIVIIPPTKAPSPTKRKVRTSTLRVPSESTPPLPSSPTPPPTHSIRSKNPVIAAAIAVDMAEQARDVTLTQPQSIDATELSTLIKDAEVIVAVESTDVSSKDSKKEPNSKPAARRGRPPKKTSTKTTKTVAVEEPISHDSKTAEVLEQSASIESELENPETAKAVEELLTNAKSTHDLYLSMVKYFGQKKGVVFYRETKSRFYAK
ncbi:MAG: PIN domain-containing protein [Oscillospiraceae bacterium]|nr:PIN domain-containing protein [Oscillospiraceae bacterium]